jgi:transposase
LANSPDKAVYDAKLEELKDLFALEDKGEIKIFFGDESGFSLTPYIPYGWQKIGTTQAIPSQRSKQINVFGLLTRDNEYEAYWTDGSINSEVIISSIDNFVQKVKQKTVLILDNAPTHKSNAFKSKMDEWKEQNLEIFFLPTYSPHLNLIETLWRKMKYEWLKPGDYTSIETLTEAIANITREIGNKLTIKFKSPLVSVI